MYLLSTDTVINSGNTKVDNVGFLSNELEREMSVYMNNHNMM